MSAEVLPPAPAHRVGRLSLHVSMDDKDLALSLRSRAESMAAHLLPQVIERVLDRLVPPGRVIQLQRLDLDLGTLAADRLEADGAAALEQVLESALREALPSLQADVDPLAASHGSARSSMSPDQALLRRLQAYLLDGVVPFRSTGDAFDPAADLARLLAAQPLALRRCLTALADDRHALRRLAAQLGNPGLRARLEALVLGIGAGACRVPGDAGADDARRDDARADEARGDGARADDARADDARGDEGRGWRTMLRAVRRQMLLEEKADRSGATPTRPPAGGNAEPDACAARSLADEWPGAPVAALEPWASGQRGPARTHPLRALLHGGGPEATGVDLAPALSALPRDLALLLAQALARPTVDIATASLQLLDRVTPGDVLAAGAADRQTAWRAWAAALASQGAAASDWGHWLRAVLQALPLAPSLAPPPGSTAIVQQAPQLPVEAARSPRRGNQPASATSSSRADANADSRQVVHAQGTDAASRSSWRLGVEAWSTDDVTATARHLREAGISPTEVLAELAADVAMHRFSSAAHAMATSESQPLADQRVDAPVALPRMPTASPYGHRPEPARGQPSQAYRAAVVHEGATAASVVDEPSMAPSMAPSVGGLQPQRQVRSAVDRALAPGVARPPSSGPAAASSDGAAPAQRSATVGADEEARGWAAQSERHGPRVGGRLVPRNRGADAARHDSGSFALRSGERRRPRVRSRLVPRNQGADVARPGMGSLALRSGERAGGEGWSSDSEGVRRPNSSSLSSSHPHPNPLPLRRRGSHTGRAGVEASRTGEGFPGSDPSTNAARWIGALQDYLATGEPALAGVYLRTGLRDDAPAMAALLRSVAAASSSSLPTMAARVLEWLTPLEVLRLLAPAAWIDALAEPEPAPHGRTMQPDWPQWVQAALCGDAHPPPWKPVPAAWRGDSLAALAHWLDHGLLPAWAATDIEASTSLRELPRRPWADLWLLFASPSAEVLQRRLTRAVRALGTALGSELLSRLVPARPPAPDGEATTPSAPALPAHDRALPAPALDVAWGAWLQAALPSATAWPLPSADATARPADRTALLSHWLDHGALPAWAPPEASAAELLHGVVQWPLAERLACLAAGGREALPARLRRAVQWLGPIEGPRWLALVMPALPSAEREEPASAAPRETTAALARGAYTAVESRALIHDDVQVHPQAVLPAATMQPPRTPDHEVSPPAPAAPHHADAAEAERLQALHWLTGRADAVEPCTLDPHAARMLADALDSEGSEFDAAVQAAARQPDRAERWAVSLPDELLGRLLHRLAPMDSASLTTAMVLLTAAASPVDASPAPATPARLPWAALLTQVAASPRPGTGSDGPRRVVQALASTLSNGHAAQAAQLLRRARQLARDTGHLDVLALFQPMPPAAQGPSRPPAPRPRRGPPQPPPGQTIYLANAGLVLIGPYLPMCLDRLGLLSTGEDGRPRVKGLQAATRAVHLLQYLVDGRLDRPEPDLVLNKLLAGLLPADVVLPRCEPEPSDLATCDGLLQAVISNWTIIRNSSTAALRETFLQREGRLVREADRWTLLVQRKAVDVLVDQLPWGFSVVYHRWMADPIHVTW